MTDQNPHDGEVARKALEFAYPDFDSLTVAVGDMLTDLMHLCRTWDIDFEEMLEGAQEDFRAEAIEPDDIEEGYRAFLADGGTEAEFKHVEPTLRQEDARVGMVCIDPTDGSKVKLVSPFESWVWEVAVWHNGHWSCEGDRIHIGDLEPTGEMVL